MSSHKIVHLSGAEESHWVEKFLYARDQVNAFKAMMEEAKEEWLNQVGEDWDVVEVDGRPVLENIKTTPHRFSVADLKKRYPAIYDELVKQVPQSSIKVLGS